VKCQKSVCVVRCVTVCCRGPLYHLTWNFDKAEDTSGHDLAKGHNVSSFKRLDATGRIDFTHRV